MNMRSRLNWNVGPGERLFGILLGGAALVGGAVVIPAGAFTTGLIFAVVFAVTAIAGWYFPYFHPEVFGRENCSERPAEKSQLEESHTFRVNTSEDKKSTPACPPPDDRSNDGIGCEATLDSAVERIVHGLNQYLRNL